MVKMLRTSVIVHNFVTNEAASKVINLLKKEIPLMFGKRQLSMNNLCNLVDRDRQKPVFFV